MRSLRHRPVVRSRVTPEGIREHRCECDCGPLSPWNEIRGHATAARDHHIASVAPPADERCRDTRAHRTRWWDPCPVCAYQLALPGFEEIA